jgi:hypothetical protein
MKTRQRLAYIFILIGFLDGRLVTYQALNGLPFPPEIRIPGKQPLRPA